MEEIDLPGWLALGPELQKLRDQLAKGTRDHSRPELLFRGQSDSEWQLNTTLERAGCEGMSFAAYYGRAVARVKSAVETFTGVKWDAPDFSIELENSFRSDRELFSLHHFPTVDFYRYMVYLRHHGFPSPLLDWTESMNVAAFFAFRDDGKAPMRSIFVYCERPNVFKGGAVGEPAMRAIGKYVRSHPRHFRQQSNYTICANFEQNSGWHFHPHGPVFGNRGKQDFLWKFNVPSSERVAVLRQLDEYNLNAFSLFDTEETLLETMWFREHVLRIRD